MLIGTSSDSSPYLEPGSNDPEFDDYHRQFSEVEQGTDKLIKDTKAFIEAVTGNSNAHCFHVNPLIWNLM